MPNLHVRLAMVGAVAGIVVALAGIVQVRAPVASAQTVCAQTPGCTVVNNVAFYPGATPVFDPATGAYDLISMAPAAAFTIPTSYVAPTTYVTPTTYVAPTTFVAPSTFVTTTEPAIGVGPEPTYVFSGGYCTLPGGEQIWVPAGASPASMGC